ncbi:MAG: tRNA (guanosine(46)-N7)-methyltransferase TrmB [Proteobacteria bacterium]|nr:tRNA (guanosine(46)-N7)-methyltransferase TrmB [Pseudomonadota bacterium]
MTKKPNVSKPVRSFVRREGRMTNAQKKAIEELKDKYGIDGAEKISDGYPFAEGTDIHLEIGFGDGEALMSLAKSNLESGFIGIDPHRPGAGRVLLKMARDEISNARVIIGDAAELLPSLFQPQSLTRILVLFPDPWPKKRHHKRRLINQNFLGDLADTLKPGGILHIATDWQDYAESIVETLTSVTNLKNTSETSDYCPRPSWRPETKYERRGLSLGHQVFDIGSIKNES